MFPKNPGDPGSCIGAVVAKYKNIPTIPRKYGIIRHESLKEKLNKRLNTEYPKLLHVVSVCLTAVRL